MHSWRPTAKRSPRPRAYKVVLAGEWHLTPDGVRAAAVPASLTSPRPFAEEEPAPMPAKKKAPALKADAKVEEIRAAYRREQEEARRLAAAKAGAAVTTEPLVAGALEAPTTPAPAATTPFRPPTRSDIDDPTTQEASGGDASEAVAAPFAVGALVVDVDTPYHTLRVVAVVGDAYTLCYHDAGAWQGEKVSRRRQSLVALGAALPRRRRASPPAPTFEKDVLAETPSSAAPAAGRRRRTRPVPGTLPAVTPLPAPKKRAADEPPRRKKPCFGGASVETLEAIESRFLGATLPLQ